MFNKSFGKLRNPFSKGFLTAGGIAAEANARAAELKQALERQPRIRDLAKNPLLLTIIGVIHRYEAQLPEDRLMLYDKAVEALLYTWDNVKRLIDEKFKLDEKRRFLERTAIHLQSLEKGDEAGVMIERCELYGILAPEFCRIFGGDNRQARGLMDEFLDKIRDRSGLIVELSHDRFGFVHKTFQEYFAAKWLANEVMDNLDLKTMIDYVERFIDNPFWQETLLLALRALPSKQAIIALKHILEYDPLGVEPDFYHHHYFVMKFLAADPNMSDWVRSDCAEDLGRLGEKEKAAAVLVELYRAQPDKTKDEAKWIYSSLWDVTAVG